MFQYKKWQMNLLHYVGTFTVISSFFLFPSWEGWAITIFAYYCTGCLGQTITFHRYLSHGSFQYKYSWMEPVFSTFGALGGTGSGMLWAAIHKLHHKYSDTDKDPHGPHKGFWKPLLVVEYPEVDPRLVRRLFKKKYHVATHKYYSLILLAYWTLLYLIGDLWLVAYAGIMPASIQIWISITSSYFNHGWGYKNFEGLDDEATNTWWLSILTWGEAWHNNHHAKPWAWDFRYKWWEIDISGLTIKYLLMKKEVG